MTFGFIDFPNDMTAISHALGVRNNWRLAAPGLGEQLKAALAEAGYPDAEIVDVRGQPCVVELRGNVRVGPPPFVIWKAYAVLGHAESCWPCHRDGCSSECTHRPDPRVREDA